MPNLISNLIRADWNYFGRRLTPYIVNGFPEVFDRFEQLKDVESTISPIEEKAMRAAELFLTPYIAEAIRAAENPERTECVGAAAKFILHAITDDELSFFRDVVEDTYLRDHIVIPPDTDNLVEAINKIPLCEEHGIRFRR